MDVIKFLQEMKRMCNSYSCASCPLYAEDGECLFIPVNYNDENVTKIPKAVEEWSAAHPKVTRAGLFKKEYPNADTDVDGSLIICPAHIDKTIECPDGINCWQCRAEYWLKEV